jgi:3-isopropylmalate/(R)-2-methylmalate dehydratase large subunit
MSKNIIDKIWDAHIIKSEQGVPDVFFIDVQLLHEVTSPQAFDFLREKNISIKFPERHFATIDHSIPTDEKRENYFNEQARQQVEKCRTNCAEFGVKIFDTDSGKQGIVHVIAPELGITQPGLTMVCGDSHTSTHGAFGALAFGVGTTQISHVMSTQSLLLQRPKTMKVEFIGTPNKYFSAKDAVLALIGEIGIQGGNGYAIEFCG